jgi:hypothetical protein
VAAAERHTPGDDPIWIDPIQLARTRNGLAPIRKLARN